MHGWMGCCGPTREGCWRLLVIPDWLAVPIQWRIWGPFVSNIPWTMSFVVIRLVIGFLLFSLSIRECVSRLRPPRRVFERRESNESSLFSGEKHYLL